MADRQALTVREVLSICRRTDGAKKSVAGARCGAGSNHPTLVDQGSALTTSGHASRMAASSEESHGHGLPAPSPPMRRGFFRACVRMMFGSWMAIGFTAFTATCIAWTVGMVRFMFPNVLTEPPTRFKVGFPRDVAPGQVDVRHKAKHGVWIVHHAYDGEFQIVALRAVCTHLGCIPMWLESEQSFKCPCHGSAFHKDGINFEGPAPRPLERYAIRVANDGQLEVDTSRTYQEELGQWSDPSCYVSV